MKTRAKSHFCVSAMSKLNKICLKKFEETVCRMEGNRCIIVSKIHVHFTRTYQRAPKLNVKIITRIKNVIKKMVC
jgi:hypothetical protein